MALRIVDGSEIKVSNLVCMIYSAPNYGKTTLAFTASNPLMLDFDGGAYRAGNKSGRSVVEISSWEDIEGMSDDDLDDYDTIIVDTVGWALNRLADYLMRKDARNRTGVGQPSLQGYGALKGKFTAWLDYLKGLGKDVVLIAHGEEADRSGEVVDRIDAMGGSKQVICQKSDIIGRIFITEDGKRVLNFSPTSTSLGKNVGLKNYTISAPDKRSKAYLTEILAEAKRLLNDKVKSQEVEVQRLEELRAQIEKFDPAQADEWNDLMAEMVDSKAKKADRAMLYDSAKAAGLTYDREGNAFVAPEPAEGEAEEMPF